MVIFKKNYYSNRLTRNGFQLIIKRIHHGLFSFVGGQRHCRIPK